MRTIKIPMTPEIHTVDNRYGYVAMDQNGKWYAYEKKPSPHINVWGSSGRYASITHTPELLALLDWKDTLFTVKELLCEASEPS